MNFNSYYKKIFIGGLILTFLPFLLIGAFNHPAAFDDFQGAVLVFKRGSLGFLEYFYNSWSGRYTATIILAYFNPLIFKSWLLGFRIFPAIILLLFFLSGWYFFKSLFGNFQRGDGGKAIGLSASFLALFLFSIASVSEIIYWITGASAYISATILFFLLAGSVTNFIGAKAFYQKVLFAGAALLSMAALMGTNESVIMAVGFLSFLAVVYWLIFNPAKSFFFILLFGVACIAAFLSIKAPGNAVRSAILHGNESMYSIPALLEAGIKAVLFSGLTIMDWFNNLVLLIGLIIFIPIGLELLNRNKGIAHITAIHPAFSFLGLYVFITIQAFPSYLGAGDVEPRVWSAIYFFFLLACLFNVLVLLNYFKNFFQKLDLRSIAPLKVLFVLLLVFSGDGNVSQAYLDLVLRAPEYDKNLRMRYELAANAKGKDVIVPPVFERRYKYPKTIFSSEITNKPEDGRNEGMAEYFKLRSIKLSKEPDR